MVPARILIIDDNREILESLRILLKDEFETIDIIRKPSRIQEMLWWNRYDILLLDMNFAMGETTGNEGIFWLHEVHRTDPLLPIILITAYGDIELAVKAIREGATDFITKPWDPEKLIITLKNAYHLRKSGQELNKLKNRQKQLSEDLERGYRMFHGTSEVIGFARGFHRCQCPDIGGERDREGGHCPGNTQAITPGRADLCWSRLGLPVRISL